MMFYDEMSSSLAKWHEYIRCKQIWLGDLEVVSASFLLVCFLSQKESTCETRRNVFYISSKAFSFLEKTKF